MSGESVFQRNSNVVFQDLGGSEGGVLLHLDTAGYFNLNPMGVLIWGLLKEPSGLEEIVEGVIQVVEEPPATVRSDVEQFLGDMVASDLVIRVVAGGQGEADQTGDLAEGASDPRIPPPAGDCGEL